MSLPASAATVLLIACLAVGVSGRVVTAGDTGVDGSPAIHQPGFGHSIGDVLEQRIALSLDGRALLPVTLPPLQRTGRWLQRRTARIEAARGDVPQQLLLRYQVINAPTEALAAALPPLSLQAADGRVLSVPAVPFGLVPLTLPVGDVAAGLPFMQADAPVPLGRDGSQHRALQAALVALALVLSAWALWWGYRRVVDRTRLPFVEASGALRELARTSKVPIEQHDGAWSLVHRAFNRHAQRSVTSADVDTLLQAHPWMAGDAPAIAAFYRASDARFFAIGTAPASVDLLRLSRTLAARERRVARLGESA